MINNKRTSEEQKEYRHKIVNKSQRLRRLRLKEAGYCIQCGKARPADNKTVCQDCMNKQKEYNKRSLAKKKLSKKEETQEFRYTM